MSFANFGIGIGALAQGLNQGLDIGKKLRQVSDDNAMRRARKEGMESAKQARSSAIDSLIQTGSAPSADNSMTVPTYNVGDQSFASQDEARAAAAQRVGGLDEFFQKVAAPKIYEQYMEIDPEKAEAWREWNESKQVKTAQKHWASAIMRANMGDFEGFGKDLVKAYNTRGYLDDGTEVKEWNTLKDDKGNITGVSLTLKGPDGKEFTQTVNGMEEAYRMGASLLSPENVFNVGWQEIQAAKKAQLTAANDERKFRQNVYRDERKFENQRALQTQRDDAALERTVTSKQMDAAAKKAEQEAKAATGELYRKGASPEEAKRQLVTTLARQYVDYSGRPTKSPAEIAAIADEYVAQIYGGKPQAQNPLAGGISGQAAPKGTPMILDTKTGKLVPYGQ